MRLSAIRRRGGRAWVWMLVGLLVGGGAGAGAVYYFVKGGKLLPGLTAPRMGEAKELGLIPADSTGFIHVRVRGIWKSENLAEFRKIVDKAGDGALKALDEGFAPAPSTLDRVTVVFLKGKPPPPTGGIAPKGPPPAGGEFLPGLGLPFDRPGDMLGHAVVILGFTEKFDPDRVRTTCLPAGQAKSVDGKEYWVDSRQDLGVYFSGDTIMVLGPIAAVEQFVVKQTKDGKQPEGPLTKSLELAAEGSRHIVGGINLKQFGPLDPKMFENPPEEMKPIVNDLKTLVKAEALAIGVAFREDGSKIEIRATYKNEEDATAADTALRSVAAYARKQLDEPKKQLDVLLRGKPNQTKPRPIKELPEAVLGLLGTGALQILDDYLANPPVKREGVELVTTFEMSSMGAMYVGGAAVAVGLLLPAVQKVREAADAAQGGPIPKAPMPKGGGKGGGPPLPKGVVGPKGIDPKGGDKKDGGPPPIKPPE